MLPVLSAPLPYLEQAAALPYPVEIKLNWEDHAVLIGEQGFDEVLAEADVAPKQVASVHLPPGTETRGRDVGMALTAANTRQITEFVFSQLDVVPDADLTVHPPKQEAYSQFLQRAAELSEVTGRCLSMENMSVESYVYTPEDLAFIGCVTEHYEPAQNVFLTVDTAHLPAVTGLEPDADRLQAVADRVNTDGCELVPELGMRLEEFLQSDEVVPSVEQRDPWLPTLQTLVLTGSRVSSLHFNDPVTDGVPELEAGHISPVLETVFEYVRRHEICVVLEPHAYSDWQELEAVLEWIDTQL